MNSPNNTFVVEEAAFRGWLSSHSFAANGDVLEKKYHSLLQADFPRNEAFWRSFVVPLTRRLSKGKAASGIDFRDGVDPCLQYISGANYSLFVHLALAKVSVENWHDTSLDAAYTRLASAFDVFEALVIKFHLLMAECSGVKSQLIDELSLDDFLDLAKDYYQKEYAKLHQYYLAVGNKVPPIKLPTKAAIFSEHFKEHPNRAPYLTLSGQIRAFRNAIVHDVRVGMLLEQGGSILIPKTAKVMNYREWWKVQKAVENPDLVAQDFCEVRQQCADDINRSVQVVNDLYEALLDEFNAEFYSSERSRLRELFGIQFGNGGSVPAPVERQSGGPQTGTVSTGPVSTDLDAENYPSGVFVLPAKEHP